MQSHLSTRRYGTVTHMPPELLVAGKLTPAADIYSFGVMSECDCWGTFMAVFLCVPAYVVACARICYSLCRTVHIGSQSQSVHEGLARTWCNRQCCFIHSPFEAALASDVLAACSVPVQCGRRYRGCAPLLGCTMARSYTGWSLRT